jgi:type IV pilus assembly protein PilB
LRVLIAEDDALSRTILKKTVEALGYECLSTEDGEKAWQAYEENPDLDLIISDWMMPNVDGLDLCKRVRELDRDGYTFIIFLTALGGREHPLEGMRAGADEYLTKPLDSEELREKLISASRVTALHRRMRTDTGLASGDDGGTTRTELPALRRGLKTRTRGKIWDILISQRKLTGEQLQRAIESQRGKPQELGKALVSLGYISAADLARAHAQRLNVDYVELTEADVDRATLGPVPEKLLRRHNTLPLRLHEGRLVVAMSDPTDVYALDDLRVACGLSIVPVVTIPKEATHRGDVRHR